MTDVEIDMFSVEDFIHDSDISTDNLNEAPGAKNVREPNVILYKHIYRSKLDAIEF